MKDRIRQLMASQHMSQQVFADFVGIAPATLSGIFNDRTRPTLNIVEAIKKKIPDINTDWLMFGTGQMYQHTPAISDDALTHQNGIRQNASLGSEPMLDFGPEASPTPQNNVATPLNYNSVRNTHPIVIREEVKIPDKSQRRVTEIRVYYDDQTWESFVPSKK
jgi:transcriptional regulator with XRE-family HTH domain